MNVDWIAHHEPQAEKTPPPRTLAIHGTILQFLRPLVFLVTLFLVSISFTATAAPMAGSGLNLPLQGTFAGYQLSPPLGGLKFDWPVAAVSPPGETNRLFVVEKSGRIQVLTNLSAPTQTLFLDLSDSVDTSNIETGLLGLEFHPGFATNGTFFVFRTLLTSTPGATNQLHDQLSKFQVDPAHPYQALRDSETLLFAQRDPSKSHNAGDLHFGPDGYLYVSVGEDYALWNQDSQHRQTIEGNLLGGILRLDVDLRPGNLPPHPHPGVLGHYAVPADNPFVGATQFNGLPVDPSRVRTEFWAVGLRNPWRFSIDPVTGDLFCGDVGDWSFEEINRIQPGANYGWPYLEGLFDYPLFQQTRPPAFQPEPPWISFAHGHEDLNGNCIVGGSVYRGRALPDLYGAYVFGDYLRGHIWAAQTNNTNGSLSVRRIAGDTSLAAFGRDPRDGEILVVNVGEGVIRKLIHVSPAVAAAQFPQSLEDTGAFTDLVTLQPSAGLVPYAVSLPFWSDYAIKQRWFSLPPGTHFGFQPEEPWDLPTGTVWIKHFDLEAVEGDPSSRRRVETRFLVKTADDIYGVTYRWDESQTHAWLVPSEGMEETFSIQSREGSSLRKQVWRYPSQNECRTCHNPHAGFALGFNTAQLNRPIPGPQGTLSQLQALAQAGYVSGVPVEEASLPVLVPPTDESQPLLDRVRSYLASNCSACHNAGSTLVTDAYWDARIHVPLADSQITHPSYGFGGESTASLILSRIGLRNSFQMPPIGTHELDVTNLVLVRRWIEAMPTAPWKDEDLGSPRHEGSSSLENGVWSVAGAGILGGPADQGHFLHQTITGDQELYVRWTGFSRTNTQARAGLMLRRDDSPGAPFVCLSVGLESPGASPRLWLSTRDTPDTPAQSLALAPVEGPLWLRLTRQGNRIAASSSTNALTWHSVGTREVALGITPRAGLAVGSGSPDLVIARMEGLSVEKPTTPSVTLETQFLGETNAVPGAVWMQAQLSGFRAPLQAARVDFLEGNRTLGTVTAPPYRWFWNNVPSGDHQVRVQVTDTLGNTFESSPSRISISFPATEASFLGQNTASNTPRGNWRGHYGSEGFQILGDSRQFPSTSTLNLLQGFEYVWQNPATGGTALQKSEGTERVAGCWAASDMLSFDLTLAAGSFQRLTLYLLDWDTANQRSERIELRDADTGQLLDSQKVSQFSSGVYLTWSVRGKIRVTAQSLGARNAVVSGIFLDPAGIPPTVQLVSPAADSHQELPASPILEAQAAASSGALERVEFFANQQRIGVATQPPYRLIWTNALAGTYACVARAWDTQGQSRFSDPVEWQLTLPESEALFLGIDDLFQGDWPGRYGIAGWSIPNEAEHMTPQARLSSEDLEYTWPDPHPNAPALQRPSGDRRIASVWYGDAEVQLEVSMNDGRTRVLSLYLLDWDRGDRRSYLEVSDLASGRVLDSRMVERFEAGQLLRWQVTGTVRVRLIALAGNAILNAAFLDPVQPSYSDWVRGVFPIEVQQDALQVREEADPDHDGVPNLAEYVLGLNPRVADSQAGLQLRAGSDMLDLQYRYRTTVDGLKTQLEVSPDLEHWEAADPSFTPELQSAPDWTQVRIRPTALSRPDLPYFFRLTLQP